MANITKYGEWNPAQAEKDLEEAKKQDDGSFMKLETGRNLIRIFPPRIGANSPFKIVHKHFLGDLSSTLVAAGFEKKVIVCPRFEKKQRCPICALIDAMKARGGSAADIADKCRAKKTFTVNALDRKNPQLGVRKLALSKGVCEWLLALRTDIDAGGDFTHPVEGNDVIITKTGSGKDTSYTQALAKMPSPISDDPTIMDELLESMHDLDAEAACPSEADLAPIWNLLGSMQRGAAPGARSGGTTSRAGTAGRGAKARVEDDLIDET